MDLGLKNKKTLVTGASRGPGYATTLARSSEGARIPINARDAGRLRTAAGRSAISACSISKKN
jgi:3-oxoacyl-[acyl-carrier protein] reductase